MFFRTVIIDKCQNTSCKYFRESMYDLCKCMAGAYCATDLPELCQFKNYINKNSKDEPIILTWFLDNSSASNE